jgi:hypothetical protein
MIHSEERALRSMNWMNVERKTIDKERKKTIDKVREQQRD